MYVMTQKYVPTDYHNMMRLEISILRQGSMTPLEYFSKLKDMNYKANIAVAPSALRTKFLSGLNTSIKNPLEILPIKDFNTLTHTAMQLYNQ